MAVLIQVCVKEEVGGSDHHDDGKPKAHDLVGYAVIHVNCFCADVVNIARFFLEVTDFGAGILFFR